MMVEKLLLSQESLASPPHPRRSQMYQKCRLTKRSRGHTHLHMIPMNTISPPKLSIILKLQVLTTIQH